MAEHIMQQWCADVARGKDSLKNVFINWWSDPYVICSLNHSQESRLQTCADAIQTCADAKFLRRRFPQKIPLQTLVALAGVRFFAKSVQFICPDVAHDVAELNEKMEATHRASDPTSELWTWRARRLVLFLSSFELAFWKKKCFSLSWGLDNPWMTTKNFCDLIGCWTDLLTQLCLDSKTILFPCQQSRITVSLIFFPRQPKLLNFVKFKLIFFPWLKWRILSARRRQHAFYPGRKDKALQSTYANSRNKMCCCFPFRLFSWASLVTPAWFFRKWNCLCCLFQLLRMHFTHVVFLFAALKWRMALPQTAARWTEQVHLLDWFCKTCRHAGSPSSTDPTQTSSCRLNRSPETPLSPAKCEYSCKFYLFYVFYFHVTCDAKSGSDARTMISVLWCLPVLFCPLFYARPHSQRLCEF